MIEAELLNQLLAGSDAAIALDQGGSLDLLKKPLAEHALNLEIDHHLGDDEQGGKIRNGYAAIGGATSSTAIDVPPRSSGDPQLIAKYQRGLKCHPVSGPGQGPVAVICGERFIKAGAAEPATPPHMEILTLRIPPTPPTRRRRVSRPSMC